MCTLILGIDVVGRGSVVLGANRDEDPARPSDSPGVLNERPRLVGGRDRLKGGTWLAIREKRAAVAMLNRRDEPAAASDRRSRGLFALEVAAAGDGAPAAALAFARAAVRQAEYAPFSMIFASPGECWLLAHDARRTIEVARIAPGWHVITHADLDPTEPRIRWLTDRLARWAPGSAAEAERSLLDLLRSHGEEARAGRPAAPPICLHEGRMRTVSTSLVHLTRDVARYLHVEGRPCTGALVDHSSLLDASRAGALEDRP